MQHTKNPSPNHPSFSVESIGVPTPTPPFQDERHHLLTPMPPPPHAKAARERLSKAKPSNAVAPHLRARADRLPESVPPRLALPRLVRAPAPQPRQKRPNPSHLPTPSLYPSPRPSPSPLPSPSRRNPPPPSGIAAPKWPPRHQRNARGVPPPNRTPRKPGLPRTTRPSKRPSHLLLRRQPRIQARQHSPPRSDPRPEGPHAPRPKRLPRPLTTRPHSWPARGAPSLLQPSLLVVQEVLQQVAPRRLLRARDSAHNPPHRRHWPSPRNS
mmetsp:Transcript_32802/g.76972  ORF Transcript_32802/g.76972 Transcript_32802/m.76972 type:complete len:269 (+) Transcript_32802:157-963(+)